MRSRLLLLLASVVVSLAAAEVILRSYTPGWALVYPPVPVRPALFEEYPAYGYRLWPSRTLRHPYPPLQPRDLTLTANADGFRSRREFRVRDGRPRIVVLGDSMVFGEGVEEPERFTELLETRRSEWRVDNLGMIGFGPDLMLRALESVGLDPAPQVVVMMLFTDDFRRVVPQYAGAGYAIPRFVLVNGMLGSEPYPRPKPWERLRLLQAVRYLAWRYTSSTFALNAAILDRWRALAVQHHFVPVLAFAPGPEHYWDDEMRREWLATYAGTNGVLFLDLTEPLRDAGPNYISGDSHWSPHGHASVAEALERLLDTHGLPPVGSL